MWDSPNDKPCYVYHPQMIGLLLGLITTEPEV